MNETIGQRLKRLRKDKGLTQVQLAKKSGVGQSAIGNIEAGMRGYGISVLAIAKVLETTPDYLQLSASETTYAKNSSLSIAPIDVCAINSGVNLLENLRGLAEFLESMEQTDRKAAIAMLGRLETEPQSYAKVAAQIEVMRGTAFTPQLRKQA